MMTRLSEQGRRKYAELRRAATGRARSMLCYAGISGITGETMWRESGTAADALLAARLHEASETARPVYTSESIWKRQSPPGPEFDSNGTRARWFESPESVGLRLVGLAHEVCKADYAHAHGINHKGWFLDREFQGETVAGVVYQLPGADGRARYLYGYADPHNTDSQGNGPACLALEIVTGEPRESDWESDESAREAARSADGMAERMAEAESEYQEAFRAGARARELSRQAVEAARTFAQARRIVADLFRVRHAATGGEVFRAMPGLVSNARAACEALVEARDKAREARETGHGWNCPNCEAWRDGYAEGV